MLPIIVGSDGDPHVDAVARRVGRVIVLDTQALAGQDYCLDGDTLEFGSNQRFVIDLAPGARRARGWLRRLAPEAWFRGVPGESRASAEKAAWLSLLVRVLRSHGSIEWLSEVDAFAVAENKLVMMSRARSLGIRVPRTVVTSDPAEMRRLGTRDVVVKPLGPGHYFEGDRAHAVFANIVEVGQVDATDLRQAPFLIQEVLCAQRHLRVVTVGDRAWVSYLRAAALPLDWRASEAAHGMFNEDSNPSYELVASALSIARALRVGYTSQDWIETTDGLYLLDVNPGGQWLFLPPDVSDSVTDAIARWLANGSRP